MKTKIIEIDTTDVMGNKMTLHVWLPSAGELSMAYTNKNGTSFTLDSLPLKGNPSDQRASVAYLKNLSRADFADTSELMVQILLLLDPKYVTRKAKKDMSFAETEARVNDKPVLLAEMTASGMSLKVWCKPGGNPYLMLSNSAKVPFSLSSLEGKRPGGLQGESLRKALSNLKRSSFRNTAAVVAYIQKLVSPDTLGRPKVYEADLP